MPRSARIVIPDEPAMYYIMSKRALDGFPLGDMEKDFLVDLIRRLSRIYFVEIFGFCIMSNHFHLLLRMLRKNPFRTRMSKSTTRTYTARTRS